jgi:hypothetical protein
MKNMETNHIVDIEKRLIHDRSEVARIYSDCLLGKLLLMIYDKIILSVLTVTKDAKEEALKNAWVPFQGPDLHLYIPPPLKTKTKMAAVKEMRKEINEITR